MDLFVDPNESYLRDEQILVRVLAELETKVHRVVPVHLRIDKNLMSDRGKNKFVVSDVDRMVGVKQA